MNRRVLNVVRPVLAVTLGLALGLVITSLAGEDPVTILRILVKGAFGSSYDFGMTLFYSIPLIFTGLSVSIAFHAGLFNIGAEGQLTMGALCAAATGICLPLLPAPLAPMVAIIAAFLGGAVWGAIPGWLKARRGSHEVINTIMLNFVASGLSSWVTLYLLRDPISPNAETALIAPSFFLPRLGFFGGAPMGRGAALAPLALLMFWGLLWKTVWGFEMRASGQNGVAARWSGINSGWNQVMAMFLAGGLAGWVGVGEVLGNVGKFRVGFSPDFGFIGIAVALVGRNRPMGILMAALLFGALHKGASDLDIETENVTRDLSLIFQALIVLCVTADGLWAWMEKRKLRINGD